MPSTITAAIPHYSNPTSRFNPFHIHDLTYKTVHSHPIELSLLIPKTLVSTTAHKAPLLIHWHGGALVTGSRLYPDWFALWLLDLAVAHKAVILSPDHRLLPESSGKDILDDVEDFWKWVRADLPSALSELGTGLEPNLECVAVVGESAGGWLAVQSGLLFSHIVPMNVVVSQYGQLDMRERWLPEESAPLFPEETLDAHLAMVKRGLAPRILSGALPPASRFPVMFAMMQWHRFPQILGEEARLYPMEWLDRVGKGEVPAMWVLHGKQDDLTPAEKSVKFVAKVKVTHPEAEVLFSLEEGKHSFDANMRMDEPCLRPGMDFVTKHWLKVP